MSRKRKWHHRPRRIEFKGDVKYLDALQVWLRHRYPAPEDDCERMYKFAQIEGQRLRDEIWHIDGETGVKAHRRREELREQLRAIYDVTERVT